MPVSRPRAMLIAARSSGRPSRLLRRAPVDELVDLVAALDGHAAHDGAGGLFGGDRLASLFLLNATGFRKEAISPMSSVPVIWPFASRKMRGIVVGQHRMPEAVDDVGEFGEDRRVDVGDGVEDEGIDRRLDLAAELLEDEVLVLHLGGEAAGLEQALAIPVQAVRR